MNRQEFQESIREVLEDVNDPNSEFNTVIIKEGHDFAAEMREHDPILADKVSAIVRSFENLRDYIKSRTES